MMSKENMNEEELAMFIERTEQEFFRVKESGGDIRLFLYFPELFLSAKVKDELDKLLIKEAYRQIEKDYDKFKDEFIVYDDTLIRIPIEEKDKKLELLDRMISFFIENEEYEKCTVINELRDAIA